MAGGLGGGGTAGCAPGARVGERAALAVRRTGRANERAEVHKGEVVVAGFCGRDEGTCGAFEWASGGVAGERCAEAVSADDAGDVSVEQGHCLVMDEAAECGFGVGSYAGERSELGWVRWKGAAVVLDDDPGSGMECEGAAVVPESAPGCDDVGRGSGGKGMEGGPALEPGVVGGDDALYLRLLEHDFGDEDGVGVTGEAPGEVMAAVGAVPRVEGGVNGGDLRRGGYRGHRRSCGASARVPRRIGGGRGRGCARARVRLRGVWRWRDGRVV